MALYRKEHSVIFIPVINFLLVVHFGAMMYFANWQFMSFQVNPMMGPSVDVLLSSGAQTTSLIVDDKQWPRLATSMFVHAGLIHLLLNVMGLRNVGNGLERAFGSGKVAIIYFSSGVFASLASAVFLPEFICVGASGAIFGIFGAYWSDFIQNRTFDRETRCCSKGGELCSLFWNTAFAMAFTLLPMVNAFAHIGGFMFGLFAGNFLIVQDRWTRERQSRRLLVKNSGMHWCQIAIAVASLALCVAAFLTMVAQLNSDDDIYEKCDWCRYLQCFETPWWSCDSYGVNGGGNAAGGYGEGEGYADEDSMN